MYHFPPSPGVSRLFFALHLAPQMNAINPDTSLRLLFRRRGWLSLCRVGRFRQELSPILLQLTTDLLKKKDGTSLSHSQRVARDIPSSSQQFSSRLTRFSVPFSAQLPEQSLPISVGFLDFSRCIHGPPSPYPLGLSMGYGPLILCTPRGTHQLLYAPLRGL